jgi:hypothetical protein
MLTVPPTVLRTLSSEGPRAGLTASPSLLQMDPRGTIKRFSASAGLLLHRGVYGPSAPPSSVAAAVFVSAGLEAERALCHSYSLDQALGSSWRRRRCSLGACALRLLSEGRREVGAA